MDIVFDEVKIYLPKTIEAITTARRLLDLVEEEIVDGWVCKHCGCTENMPCPDGCSWVAPNVCSRCAEENAPEIPKPETSRNVSTPARESSLTTEKYLNRPDKLKGLAKRNVVNDIIAPLATVSDTLKPETQGSKTADSHSAGATSMSSSTEKLRVAKPPVTHSAKSKLGTPNNDQIMHPGDLKLQAFEYNKHKMQQYKSLLFQEMHDGRVILDYSDSHYYSTKELVLEIPYPFLPKYFSKENGWSSSVEQAFKTYRRYLAEQEQQQKVETEKGEQQTQKEMPEDDPDDWKYKRFGIVNTQTDYDGNKIEGTLGG